MLEIWKILSTSLVWCTEGVTYLQVTYYSKSFQWATGVSVWCRSVLGAGRRHQETSIVVCNSVFDHVLTNQMVAFDQQTGSKND